MKTLGSKISGGATGRPTELTAGSADGRGSAGPSVTSTVVSETVVITGMALTTLALGTGLYLQAGVDAMGALLIALGGYAAMLLMHAFVRQSTAPGRKTRRQHGGYASADRSAETGAAGAGDQTAEFGASFDDEATGSLFADDEDEAAPRGNTTLSDVGVRSDVPPSPSASSQRDLARHSLPEGGGDPFGTLRPKSGPAFDGPSTLPLGRVAASDDVVTQPVILKPSGRSASEAASDAASTQASTQASTRASDAANIRASNPVASPPAAAPVTRSVPSLEIGDPDMTSRGGVSIVSGPPREADVEMIQSLIKKLADEVNAASTTEGARDKSANSLRSGRGAGAEGAAARADEPGFDAQGAIEQSVGALRSTADTMRARQTANAVRVESETRGQVIGRAHSGVPQDSDGWRDDRVAEEHELAHGSQLSGGLARELPGQLPEEFAAEPAFGPIEDARDERVHARLGAITDAIAAGRIDVLLDPILGISDGKARHFEVAVRLRDSDENAIDLSEGLEDVAKTGVLPLLDRARLSRTSQLALRLEARGRNGALFSQFTGESLITDQFLDEFADAYREREGFAGQLVMTFSQADIRSLGAREWSTLADMADLGFRFAVSGVCDLDMDFEDLRSRGFQFVKLDADVFLNGLPAAEITIPAGDICKHLAGVGMTLIVGEIADEQVAAKVFGFGVLFGQGALFGGPRLVKQTAVSSDRDSSAAA